MDLFTLYLISILPQLGFLFGILATLFGLISLVCWIAAVDGPTSGREAKMKLAKLWFITALSIVVPAALIPSEKALYAIAGGYVATNNEEFVKLPRNVAKAANAYLNKIAKSSEKE